MKVVTVAQMRTLDKITIEKTGIPGVVLMENAAEAVFKRCVKFLKTERVKSAVVVCGSGNNGGDGFAVARKLVNIGVEVVIFFFSKEEKLKGDSLINFGICKNMNIPIEKDYKNAEEVLKNTSLIVDALFGTGFSGSLREEEAYVVKKINESKKYVISVDIPSGIDGDSGRFNKTCVVANETVTFQLPKIGNILYPGGEVCGELIVADISIPQENIEAQGININILTKDMAKKILPKRDKRSNKGSFGKVFIFAGNKDMAGAAVLSAIGAYKSGCGLLYVCQGEEGRQVMQSLVPEAVFNPVTYKNGIVCKKSLKDVENINKATALIVGPGLGGGKNVEEFVEEVVKTATVPILLDADALNAIGRKEEIFKSKKSQIVITPHPMEMSRLTGFSVKEILENMVEIALEFAKKNNIVVLLKDARTVIASPQGKVFINTSGNSSMAKAGSGDVLSGIIGSFLGQGMDPFCATVLGAYVHGKAGEISAKALGEFGVLARDIGNNVAIAIKEIQE